MRGLMTGLLGLGVATLTLACAMPIVPTHPGVFASSCDLDRRLRVMTVHAAVEGDGSLLEQVQTVDPDVLVVSTDDDWATPLHRLDTRFPYATRHVDRNGAGLRIYAHHPIDQPEPAPEGAHDRTALHANLVLPDGDTVQLLATGRAGATAHAPGDWLASADRAGRRDVPTLVVHADPTSDAPMVWRGALRPIDEGTPPSRNLCLTAPRGAVALPTRAHRDAARATLVAAGQL